MVYPEKDRSFVSYTKYLLGNPSCAFQSYTFLIDSIK